MCFYRRDEKGYKVPKRVYNGKIAYKWYYKYAFFHGVIYSPYQKHAVKIGERIRAEGETHNINYIIKGGFFHAYLSDTLAMKAAGWRRGDGRPALFKVKLYGEGYQNREYGEIVAKEMEVIEEVDL